MRYNRIPNMELLKRANIIKKNGHLMEAALKTVRDYLMDQSTKDQLLWDYDELNVLQMGLVSKPESQETESESVISKIYALQAKKEEEEKNLVLAHPDSKILEVIVNDFNVLKACEKVARLAGDSINISLNY